MYEKVRKLTATSLFIVPTLGISREEINRHGFENAYVKDEIKNIDYNNAVYLLFRPPLHKMENFTDFLTKERARKARIIDEYDYPDGWIMLVYQYEDKWKEDVETILSGKFSKTSREFQNLTPKTVKYNPHGLKNGEDLTVQHQIYKKDPRLANFWNELYGLEFNYEEDEYWERYEEREIFNEITQKKLI